jgi:dTDP-6-deoxy-L-talose 4-dehydrogenase (NAD+)
MRTVYILGFNGFIGKNVIEYLKSESLFYISRDDFNKIIQGELFFYFRPEDVLINLAWDNLDNFRTPLHISDILPAHIRFYDNVLKMGLQNITAIGTCVEYGMVEGELHEDLPSNPVLPYAIAKDSLRRYIDFKKIDFKFNFNWIRLFFIYGEGQPERTIYSQIKEAVESGKESLDMSYGLQKRDYLHVSTVAEIISRIALSEKSNGIINCCSGRPITLLEFVHERLGEFKYNLKLNLGKFPYPKYEAFEFWGSVEKLKSVTKQSSHHQS